MKRRTVQSREFKQAAVRRVAAGEEVSAVARDLGIDRRRLDDWRRRAEADGLEALRGPGRAARGEGRVLTRLRGGSGPMEELARRRMVELERKVAQQELDLDFFRQALRHVKVRQQEAAGRGGLRSTKSSRR